MSLAFSTTPLAAVREPHPFEEWPALFLSYAYAVRQDSGFLARLTSGTPPTEMGDYQSPLIDKYIALHRILESGESEFKANPALVWASHYCWVKWRSEFSCGDTKRREFSDNGYLYVTDPIWPQGAESTPFLIVIISGLSPRHTAIYRLFQGRMELVYDLFQTDQFNCGLTDPGTGLFVTYGVDVTVDGGMILTETEGFHWDMLPRRKFYLKLTAESCELVQVEIE